MSTLNTYNLKSPDSASTNLALDASGNVAIQTGSASAPSIYVTGDANTGIYSPGGDQVALTTGGSARLYISSSGQVGIGTTSANAKLVVSNGGAGGLEVSPDNSSATIYSYNRSTSSYIEQRYDGSSHIFQVGGSSHERARIDSSGRLLVGTSTSITSAGTSGGGAGSTPALQVVHPYQNVNPAGISLSRFQASNPYGAVFTIQKSKNDTIGSHAVVASGDELGVISFDGSNGTAFNTAATISAVVDGTPGANDMPGRLVFSTTADGASSPTERMRIGSDGLITISGPGIKFPATQVASTDPNTLDDYEEGTWTPVIDNAYATAPTVTYTSRDGWYRKCGSLVTVYFKIVVNTYSGGGGPIQLDGMPFGISSYTPGNIIGPAIVSGIAPPASTTGLYVGTFRLDNGGERLVFFGKSTGTTAESNALCIQSTSSLGGCTFRGSFSYIV
jgi:hypothetical protein